MKVLIALMLLVSAPMTFAKTLSCSAAIYDSAKNTKDYFDFIDSNSEEDIEAGKVEFLPTPIATRAVTMQVLEDGSLWSDALTLSSEDFSSSYNFAVNVENNLITSLSIENELRHTGTGFNLNKGLPEVESTSSDFDTYLNVSCSIKE